MLSIVYPTSVINPIVDDSDNWPSFPKCHYTLSVMKLTL